MRKGIRLLAVSALFLAAIGCSTYQCDSVNRFGDEYKATMRYEPGFFQVILDSIGGMISVPTTGVAGLDNLVNASAGYVVSEGEKEIIAQAAAPAIAEQIKSNPSKYCSTCETGQCPAKADDIKVKVSEVTVTGYRTFEVKASVEGLVECGSCPGCKVSQEKSCSPGTPNYTYSGVTLSEPVTAELLSNYGYSIEELNFHLEQQAEGRR